MKDMTIWVSLINIFVILNYCKIYDFVIQKVKTQLSKQPYKGIIIVGLVLGFNIFHLSFMCIIMVQFSQMEERFFWNISYKLNNWVFTNSSFEANLYDLDTDIKNTMRFIQLSSLNRHLSTKTQEIRYGIWHNSLIFNILNNIFLSLIFILVLNRLNK